MNRFWFKPILLIALFATLFLVNTADLRAHNNGYTFQAYAAVAPTIAGNIDEDEWKCASKIIFDLGEGYSGTLCVMNDADNLYVAAKIADDKFDKMDGFHLFFDNDNDGIFPESGDDYLLVKGDGLHDFYMTGSGPREPAQREDTYIDGTQDGYGVMADGGMENTTKINSVELSHPLNSTDDLHDFSLSAGSTVGFRIQYYDWDSSRYTGYWPGEWADEFGDIVVAASPSTLTAFASKMPVIDGTVDTTSEWAAASTASINFGWIYSGTLYVMNDEENLYIAAKISDVDLTQGDFLVILFDNDNDGTGWEDGEDQLQLIGSTNFGDGFFQNLYLKDDVSDGGTKDGEAKASNDGSYNYYEFKHPLDSTDDSHDISLSEGSTIGLAFQYRDETANYWGDWPSSNAASWAKATIASGSDFSISANPTSVSIAQGASGSSIVNITSLHSFSQNVALSYSWFGNAPSHVTINLPGPIIPPPDKSATSELQISAGGSATIGSFTIRVTGSSGNISHFVDVSLRIAQATATTPSPTLPIPIPRPECIIATAAYGSEISGEVQFLRSFRDDKVMQTFAGSSFIKAFNAFYYSFSPSAAQFISENSVLKSLTRVLLYPLIGSLFLSSLIFNPLSFTPEMAVVASGFTASILLGAVYLFPMATVVLVILKRRGYAIKTYKMEWMAFAAFVGLLAITIGELAVLRDLIMIGSSLFVVSTLVNSGMALAIKAARRL